MLGPGDTVVMTANLAPAPVPDLARSHSSPDPRDLTQPVAVPCMPRATLCTAPEGFTFKNGTTLWEARVNRSLCKSGILTTALFARTPCPYSCQLAQEQRKFSKQRWLLNAFLLAALHNLPKQMEIFRALVLGKDGQASPQQGGALTVFTASGFCGVGSSVCIYWWGYRVFFPPHYSLRCVCI